MDDLIFMAAEKCLMPRLMKIRSLFEKTLRSCPWRFYSKFHQDIVGGGWGWGDKGGRWSRRAAPLPQSTLQFSVALCYRGFSLPNGVMGFRKWPEIQLQVCETEYKWRARVAAVAISRFMRLRLCFRPDTDAHRLLLRRSNLIDRAH